MIKLYMILRCLLAVLPFTLLAILAMKNNLPKVIRCRQLFMPVIALAYCFGITYLLEKLMKVVMWLLEMAKRYIPFLENVNWSYWILLITNIVVLLLYFPVKKLVTILLKKTWKYYEKGMRKWKLGFYYYDEDLNQWVLKEYWGHLKHFYTYIYVGAVLAASALLLINYLNKDIEVFQYRYYAVFGIIVLGEIVAYFGGLTATEYRRHILEMEPDEEEEPDFASLRETYRDIYGKRILADTYTDNGDDGEKQDPEELLQKIQENGTHGEAAFAAYLAREMSYGQPINRDYVRSVSDMLQGKSVLYANPFYRDLTGCIYFPMNMALLKQGKALIILGQHGLEDEIKSWAEEGMESVCHVPGFWKVDVLKEAQAECDIGILSFKDLFNLGLHEENKAFLQDVTFVVILEPSRVIAHSQVALNMLAKTMDRQNKNIVYCACDRNMNGLVDSLSHVLRTEFVEVKATGSSAKQSTCLYWNADGEAMHHKLIKGVVRYLGGGTSLAMVALKDGIKKVSWFSETHFPVRDIRWIAGQYYEKICKYIERPVAQEELDDSFKVSSSLWSMEKEEHPVMVVEDEYHNLFEMGRQFATRGTKMSFVNVLSSNYMLRDYMCDNYRIFKADPKAMAQVVPDFARTRRNVVLQLIMRMAEDELSSREIEKELTIAGIQADLTREGIEALIGEFFDLTPYGIVVRETHVCDELDWEHEVLCRCHYYKLCNEDFIRDCVTMLRNAYYMGEDDLAGKHFLDGRLLDHVYQAFIPGQFFTFSGKYYQILSISQMENPFRNAVMVRRAADHVDSRVYYRQLRTYQFDEEGFRESEEAGGCRTLNQIKIHSGYVNVSIQTRGYLEMKDYNDLAHALRVEVSQIPVRQYRNKQALKIELPGAPATVTLGLAVMLNEIFRTVYPDSSEYIAALAGGIDEPETFDGLLYALEGESEPYCIYIVEDSQLDLGLVTSVERNLKKYLEIAMDYLDWTWKLMNPDDGTVKTGEPITDEDLDGIREEKKKKKKSWWKRFIEWIKRLLHIKPKEEKEEGEPEPAVEGGEGEPEFEPVEGGADGETEGEGGVPEGATEPVGEGVEEASEGEPEDKAKPVGEDADVEPGFELEPVSEGAESEPGFELEPVGEGAESEPGFELEPVIEGAGEASETGTELVDVDGMAVPGLEPVEYGIVEVPEAEGIADGAEPVNRDDTESAEVSDTADVTEDAEDSADNDDTEGETIGFSIRPSMRQIMKANLDGNGTQIDGDDEVIVKKPEPSDHLKKHYLKYGGDEILPIFDIPQMRKYLIMAGVGDNSFGQTRKHQPSVSDLEKNYNPHDRSKHFCDFCGCDMTGMQYDTLKDGRERCPQCAVTAVRTVEEFKDIYRAVVNQMEAFYNINLNVPVQVKMTDAKTLAKRLNSKFVATPGFDGRCVGVAIKDHTGYSLLIENGAPRLSAISTIAHELTHIWQYSNWDLREVERRYGKDIYLEIMEGMAKWSEIQFMMLMDEKEFAKREEIITRMRDDEYGRGFLLYIKKYPFYQGRRITGDTPFLHKNDPL